MGPGRTATVFTIRSQMGTDRSLQIINVIRQVAACLKRIAAMQG